MREIKYYISGLFTILLFASCMIISSGRYDQHGQFVPKHSRFTLKDKHGNIVPKLLDTNAVYKVHSLINRTNPKNQTYHKVNVYLRFYGNGRFLLFSSKDPAAANLRESNINPDDPFSSKGYYYSEDGKTVKAERFVKGDGGGAYVISLHKLDD